MNAAIQIVAMATLLIGGVEILCIPFVARRKRIYNSTEGTTDVI